MDSIADNVAHVKNKIAQAAERADRDPADVTLVAVTKTWSPDVLRAAHTVGLRHFGENRTHELAEKHDLLADEMPDIVWHYIGHLQSRQSQAVADCADVFHAADRMKIIRRLDRQVGENGRRLPIFIQVNVSGEDSKGGFDMDEGGRNDAQWQTLLQAARRVHEAAPLDLRGLMTMAPYVAPDEVLHDVFGRTRRLRDRLQETLGVPLSELSMGMTNDYEIAIAHGATQIRVGRALFGARDYG